MEKEICQDCDEELAVVKCLACEKYYCQKCLVRHLNHHGFIVTLKNEKIH